MEETGKATGALASAVVQIVFWLGFLFWGVIEIWGIIVAFIGGRYPWPLDSDFSQGGELLHAVGFFFGGALAAGATLLAAWLVLGLPLKLIESLLRVVRAKKA